MVKLQSSIGRKKGERGITIKIIDRDTEPSLSRSFTVHGLSVDQLYENMKMFIGVKVDGGSIIVMNEEVNEE